MSSETDINSSSRSPEKDTDLGKVATSSDDPNPSQGQSVMYSSTKTSTQIDVNRATTPALIENDSTEGKKEEEEEEEEEVEDDEDDDFPIFYGGEPRGRVVQPVAGTKTRPARPK